MAAATSPRHTTADWAFRLRGIRKSYVLPGGAEHCAFDSDHGAAPLEIPRNRIVAVVGRSGSGKSTFLNLVAGNLSPDPCVGDNAPQLLFAASEKTFDLTKTSDLLAAKSRLGPIFQDSHFIEFLSNKENVALPLRLQSLGVSSQALADLAKFVHVKTELLDKMPDEISGGQAQRLGIARALTLDPEVVIADEPTSSVDPPTAEGIISALARWRKRKAEEGGTLTVLWVTHDIRLAVNYADQILLISDGAVAERFCVPETPDSRADLLRTIEDRMKSVHPNEPASIHPSKPDPHQRRLFARSFVRNSVLTPQRGGTLARFFPLSPLWSSVGSTVATAALMLFFCAAVLVAGTLFRGFLEAKVQDPRMTFIETSAQGETGKFSDPDLNKFRSLVIQADDNQRHVDVPNERADKVLERLVAPDQVVGGRPARPAFRGIHGIYEDTLLVHLRATPESIAAGEVPPRRAKSVRVTARSPDDPLLSLLQLTGALHPSLTGRVPAGASLRDLFLALDKSTPESQRCARSLQGIFLHDSVAEKLAKLGLSQKGTGDSNGLPVLVGKPPRRGLLKTSAIGQPPDDCYPAGRPAPKISGTADADNSYFFLPVLGTYSGPASVPNVLVHDVFYKMREALQMRHSGRFDEVWFYPNDLIRDGNAIFYWMQSPPREWDEVGTLKTRFDLIRPVILLTRAFTTLVIVLVLLSGALSIYVAFRAAVERQRHALGILLAFGATDRQIQALYARQASLIFVSAGTLAIVSFVVAAGLAHFYWDEIEALIGLERGVSRENLSGFWAEVWPRLACLALLSFGLLQAVIHFVVRKHSREDAMVLLSR